ncbi:MAG: SDR family NAD(P)-dependent oxidoreductase, partial [Acidobacteria bacterium]|nr:SDR family NAD(P)-dependent oxidoreductase [Acidobacteriota bacterium]
MELTNRVALITGGKRIGLVVAGALAERGVDVALSYLRSRTEAAEAVERVRAAARRGVAIQADLSTVEGCEAAVRHAVETFGR